MFWTKRNHDHKGLSKIKTHGLDDTSVQKHTFDGWCYWNTYYIPDVVLSSCRTSQKKQSWTSQIAVLNLSYEMLVETCTQRWRISVFLCGTVWMNGNQTAQFFGIRPTIEQHVINAIEQDDLRTGIIETCCSYRNPSLQFHSHATSLVSSSFLIVLFYYVVVDWLDWLIGFCWSCNIDLKPTLLHL
jgi:hypothetical protein